MLRRVQADRGLGDAAVPECAERVGASCAAGVRLVEDTAGDIEQRTWAGGRGGAAGRAGGEQGLPEGGGLAFSAAGKADGQRGRSCCVRWAAELAEEWADNGRLFHSVEQGGLGVRPEKFRSSGYLTDRGGAQAAEYQAQLAVECAAEYKESGAAAEAKKRKQQARGLGELEVESLSSGMAAARIQGDMLTNDEPGPALAERRGPVRPLLRKGRGCRAGGGR